MDSLAGNPSNLTPKFSVECKLSDGAAISLADPKSTRALVALMDMEAVIGGAASHYGGPAAFAEMMSACYGLAFHSANKKGKQWHEMFHIINDAGHCENGIYALKANYQQADLSISALKAFRSIASPLTGHGEAHIFPQGVYLSNGPLGSSIGAAQGLCAADRLEEKSRTTVVAISDGACMEGEAKEAFAAIPGLASKGRMNPFVLMISDNNTKLSGRISEEAFDMNPTFRSLETLGWKVIEVANGNDLQATLAALESAMHQAEYDPNRPVALWFKTIKGIGTEATAGSSSGGHGFPLKSAEQIRNFVEEIYGEESLPTEIESWVSDLEARHATAQASQSAAAKQEPKVKKETVKKEKIQVGISRAMVEAAEAGKKVISITSDLPGSTGVAGFRKSFPDKSFDVGVAESNMMSMAAGLSKESFIPVVDTFAQFGTTKGALPLIMANLSLAPMICVFSHTGFQDAADGASHQSLSYLSMMASIAHTRCYSLSCSEEAYHLMSQAIEGFVQAREQGRTPDSVVFFLGRENFPQYYRENLEYRLGSSQVVHENLKDNSVTLAANGSLIPHALEAARQLADEGIGSVVVNTSSLNFVDSETFRGALTKTQGRLVTVEDHQVIGGMGMQIVHQLVQNSVPVKVRSLGVQHSFGQSAYKADQLYQKHHLDGSAIVSAAKSLLS